MTSVAPTWEDDVSARVRDRLRLVWGVTLAIAAAGCSPGAQLSASFASGQESVVARTPTGPSSPAPTALFASPAVLGGTLDLSGVSRTNIPLPTGGQLDPRGYLAADRDWVVVTLTLPSGEPSAVESVYAINVNSGERRKLLDTTTLSSGFLSLAGSRVAWASWSCSAAGETVSCSHWRLNMVDLDTGATSVVAQGANPPVAVETNQNTMALIPALALSTDTLAYTSGDLASGFRLNLLSMSSGVTRTISVGGPIEQVVWAGADLAWIEDTDLQPSPHDPAHGNNAYYTGSRLEVLPAGASAPLPVGSDQAYWLAGADGLLAWDTGGDHLWTASGRDWTPSESSFIADSTPFLSDGWLGWTSSTPGQPFLVFRRGDSVQRSVPDGVAIAGGWLFLGSKLGQYGPTQLDLVPTDQLK